MDFRTLEHHRYIKLIEYSLNHNNFTKSEACETANLSHQEFYFISEEVFVLSAYQAQSVHSNESQEWKLSPQAFFNYLQFLEFQHAIKVSKKAQDTALAAVVISGFLAIGSILATLIS